MAGIILQQAIIMLILNVVGMIAYYTGIVSREGGKQLSNVVLEIVTPVIIVHAYLEEEYDSRLVVNLLLTFVLAAASYVIAILISMLCFREKSAGKLAPIERFSATYSNCGFMGIPLASALFGAEGVFVPDDFLLVLVDTRCHAADTDQGLQKGIESVAFANGYRYRHWVDSVFCTASNAGLADGYYGLYFRLEYTACDDCIGCQRGTGEFAGSIVYKADLLGQLREIAGDSAGSYGNVPLPAVCIYGSADGCFVADSCTGCCNVYTAMSSTWLK